MRSMSSRQQSNGGRRARLSRHLWWLAACVAMLLFALPGWCSADEKLSDVRKLIELNRYAESQCRTIRSLVTLSPGKDQLDSIQLRLAEEALAKLEDSLNSKNAALSSDAKASALERERTSKLVMKLAEHFFDAVRRNSFDGFIEELDEFPNRLGAILRPTAVTILASGDVSSVLANASATTAIGTGSLGVGISSPKRELMALVSLASNADTVRANHGVDLLLGTGGFRSGYAHYVYKWPAPMKWIGVEFGGLEAYGHLGVSSGAWMFLSDPATDSLISSQITVLSADVGFANTYLDRHSGENQVTLNLRFGLACRFICGDIRTYSTALENSLGIRHTFYAGPELGLSILFNKLYASVSFMLMYPNDHVSGLNGGQVLARIQYAASLFTFD